MKKSIYFVCKDKNKDRGKNQITATTITATIYVQVLHKHIIKNNVILFCKEKDRTFTNRNFEGR